MIEKNFERILATSDLHGQYDKFMELLNKANYDSEKDLLIVCGDMIDRGTQNLATLYKCMELQENGAIILMGNHEEFLMDAYDELLYGARYVDEKGFTATDWWVSRNGGVNTMPEIKTLSNEENERIYKWVSKLPAYAMVNDFIFVHAGVNSKKAIEDNNLSELIWSTREFPWVPAYADKVVVFGHTPTFYMRPYNADGTLQLSQSSIWYDKIHGDKIGIDCGGVFGGKLAMLEIPTMKEYYV
jgi:serine/threonine protein phosphatase 1